jgi:putative DNA primase/helicase
MTSSIIDESFNLAISEIATILAGGHPSDVPLSSFGLYQEIVEMLREDYQNDPANIEKTWNFIKTLDIYAGLVVAVGQGWNDHPNRTLLSLPQILEVITTAGDESQVRMALINLRRDAAQLSNAELLQLTEIVENRLGISQTFIKGWRKLVTEIQKKTIAGNGFVGSGSARGAVPGGVAASGSQAQPTPISFHLTDLGNAKRLAANYGKDLRYVHTSGRWYIWNGIYWSVDETNTIMHKAKQAVLGIYNEAAQQTDDDKRRELIRWAAGSESASRLRDMVFLAQSEVGIAAQHNEFDSNPMLLNCKNGTIDLTTGILQVHKRSDMITRCCEAVYDPDAEAPIWDSFLDKIMAGNQKMIDFLRRAVGYSITGMVGEHVLFFMYGQTGRNGKTSFGETIHDILAGYATKASNEMVMMKKYQGNNKNDNAHIVGKRFVLMSEIESGSRLSEVQVKDLTGGDTVEGRFLYHEKFNFKPTHHIWMYGNYKPVIRNMNQAIWSKIKLIPFIVYIPPEERILRMGEVLKTESNGILNWMVRGCLEWQSGGLQFPDEVVHAVDEYHDDMDVLGSYLQERTTQNHTAKTPINTLYQDYTLWCIENGETTMKQRSFVQSLIEHGFTRGKSTGGMRVIEGIEVVKDT